MAHIILTEEQARVVAEAKGPVAVRDAQGRTVANLTPLDPADIEAIAKAKRRMAAGGRGIPAAEVRAHIQRLEEIRQREGLDREKAMELLRRMQAGEEV
jgi:antitoxin (DNA-binding transcriptional repressor) of toxin-antitoxin stability system